MTVMQDERTNQSELDDRPSLAIEVEEMSVWYGRRAAVHNLSLHVPYGSIYGLIGPSGAGKTTVLRVLATLEPPATGTVLVDGVEVRDDPAAVRERIGYLPDFSGVYEQLTLSEYLDFYGSIYGIASGMRRQLTDELLELVGLGDRRNDAVQTLSRGMKQQLGLARCLMHDPPILLLDEPAGGMDPRGRRELRDILHELRRFGKTILISSHLLGELAEVCTHLGIMRDGELIAEGSTDEIMAAASGGAQLRLTLLDSANRDQARRLLQEALAVKGGSYLAGRQIDDDGESSLLIRPGGTGTEVAELVEQLCGQGVQMTEFALLQPTLEDILLQVTDVKAEA